jgi:hypothetical protein
MHLRNICGVVIVAFFECLGSDTKNALARYDVVIFTAFTYMLPTQYPVNMIAPVSCFFVKPEMLLLIMVKLMLKPSPWK